MIKLNVPLHGKKNYSRQEVTIQGCAVNVICQMCLKWMKFCDVCIINKTHYCYIYGTFLHNLVPRVLSYPPCGAREGETLENAGHVSPRIWDITNKRYGEGAGKCEICPYKA